MAVQNMYDIGGASAGQASQLQPEERQMQRIQRMVRAAEGSNYDGDPDYYNQIKSIAMQAGIPIKQFKTNPFRLAKTGLMSMADTAMLGLLPNELYTPQGGHVNSAEASMDALGMMGGMLLPWGMPARLAKGGMAALGMGGGKGALANLMNSPRMKAFKDAFMGRAPAANMRSAPGNPPSPAPAANPLMQLGTGQKQLPAAAKTGSRRDIFGGYDAKKSVSVPKVDSHVGKGTPTTGKEKAAAAVKKATKPKAKKPAKKKAAKVLKTATKNKSDFQLSKEIASLTGKVPKATTRAGLEAEYLKAVANNAVKLGKKAKATMPKY